MDVPRYLRALRRWAWIPLLLVIATVATTGALAYLTKPEYVATATVQAKVISGNGAPAASQTLSLQEVAASHTLALAVIKQLDINEAPADLTARLRVTPGHSDLFTVAVTDQTSDRAVAIANAVAEQAALIYQRENSVANTTVFEQNIADKRRILLQRYDDAERALLKFQAAHPEVLHSSADIDQQTTYQELLLDQQAAASAYQSFVSTSTTNLVNAMSQASSFTASVLDPAVATPDRTSRYLRVGAAAGIALLLGLALVFALESMDNAIREPKTVEEMTGLPVVGIIPLATTQTLRNLRGPG